MKARICPWLLWKNIFARNRNSVALITGLIQRRFTLFFLVLAYTACLFLTFWASWLVPPMTFSLNMSWQQLLTACNRTSICGAFQTSATKIRLTREDEWTVP